MNKMRPYQVNLLKFLQEHSEDTVVIAPVGVGVRSVLISYLGQNAATEPSLIVTDRNLLVDQWLRSLADAGLIARSLSSRAEALEWATGDISPLITRHEVAVTTWQRLGRSFVRAGSGNPISTLLIDGSSVAAEGLYRQ